MTEEMTLEQLATLPYNNLLFALDSNDQRWLGLIPLLKDLCPDFEGWLMANKLGRTPENALEYISVQYEKKYAERDRREMDRSFQSVHEASCKAGFHALLDKRFRDYRNSPYRGELQIGHFVGVKDEMNIEPDKIKNHRIGEIKKVCKNQSGHIVSFILNNEIGESFAVPFENTYRIY